MGDRENREEAGGMKAIIHQGKGLDGARLTDMPVLPVRANQVRVRLKAAALNHRDLWTCLYRAPEQPPVILGADGAGVVEEVGAGIADLAAGTPVIINASQDWLSGLDVPRGEYNAGYKILGYPDHGTFAEQIVIARHQLEPKPAFLSYEEAAALSLVGLTTYRALFTEGALLAGQTVVIPGIGGGAATQALLFAKCAGARVVVTSRVAAKLERARALGADLALPTQSDWAKAVRDFTDGRGAELVIETVGDATWSNSIKCLANGGKIVVFGATSPGPISIDPRSLFLHWQSIRGTTMGSRDEFCAMLRYAEAFKVKPVIDCSFALEDGVAALRYLDSAAQMGKVTLTMRS
jgi:zinc-binding alcohol dehydrogenase/oxidoreductase